MIYLDNAATTLQKPPEVAAAVYRAVNTCATPGRGSHAAAMRAAETVYSCREEAAALFHVPAPEQVAFTMNATHGLNIAIHSLVTPGGRVVVSGYEHNAVMRPLYALGARVDVAASPLFQPHAALEAFRARIPGAQAVICTHASNVYGFILPIKEIAALCRQEGVPLIVDAAQSAGVLDLDFAALGAAFIAMPGHKGLLGPQGTGLLLCREGAEPILFGGTGSMSASRAMPDFLPDRLEAGTVNVCGIAGLEQGLRYLRRTGLRSVREREGDGMAHLAAGLRPLPGLRLLEGPPGTQTGVLSVVTETMNCEEAAEALGGAGVAVRAGLHCAPLAHETGGTLDTGTVRLSLGPFNTEGEMRRVCGVFENILKNGYKL